MQKDSHHGSLHKTVRMHTRHDDDDSQDEYRDAGDRSTTLEWQLTLEA